MWTGNGATFQCKPCAPAITDTQTLFGCLAQMRALEINDKSGEQAADAGALVAPQAHMHMQRLSDETLLSISMVRPQFNGPKLDLANRMSREGGAKGEAVAGRQANLARTYDGAATERGARKGDEEDEKKDKMQARHGGAHASAGRPSSPSPSSSFAICR